MTGADRTTVVEGRASGLSASGVGPHCDSAVLGSGQTDPDEVHGVDPAVADGDAAGLEDRVAQWCG